MKLHINGFRITLATDRGQYGATALFKSGLNVNRAENTSGKSTLMNGDTLRTRAGDTGRKAGRRGTQARPVEQRRLWGSAVQCSGVVRRNRNR